MNYHTRDERAYIKSCIPLLSAPFNELEWKLDGFPKWYRDKIRGWKREVGYEREDVMKTRAHFVPDAFFLDEDDQTVALLEIVETNDITEYKASCLSAVAWELDEVNWEMIVVLYYPRQQRTMANTDLLGLGPIADTKFASDKYPYRTSFRSQLEAM